MAEYTRTTTHLLDIQNVSLSFGNNLVLRDVNATITNISRPGLVQGQVVCFLGPSGIGKTQMSKIVAGLQKPTSGQVLLSDGKPTHRGGVGMVPQNYPLFDFMSVESNLRVAGKQGGLHAGQVSDKTNQLLSALGLERHAAKYPAELSGGTKQRVAIARQMMCADHYLVMDEPFSGLDPIVKRKTADLIVSLADMDEDNTIIIVTHDIKQGLKVADTVWLMGYEPNPDNPTEFLPGARIVETYDLAAMNLCWSPDVDKLPEFTQLVNHIEDRFSTLMPEQSQYVPSLSSAPSSKKFKVIH
jgi:ABC-type nitrate/sulfonate/bicarbonate transport system ATPase subunit